MTETAIVQVETDGHGQIIRLPEDFHLPGGEVRVRRNGHGLVLEPIEKARTLADYRALFAELDKYKHIPFMEHGREQPPMPDDADLPSFD